MIDPPLVLTMGEPAGVGAELTVKVKSIFKNQYPFFVIGDYKFLTTVANKYSLKTLKMTSFTDPFEYPNRLCVLNHSMPQEIISGKISLKNSAEVKHIIKRAVSIVLNNDASAIVTNPIDKWAVKQSGNFPYEGHTDFLASLCNEKTNSVMMLTNKDGFRVVPLTVHLPIKKVSTKITIRLLENTLGLVHNVLKSDYNIHVPKILVTGLNPHAGERSTMGYEENDVIKPVIVKLNKTGMSLVGPVSADTAFTGEKRARFDAFVCMYHDQALIPVKTLSFDESINVTLGLSFIRTSPDHGTALDIAGKNIANPKSLILAIKEAQKIANVRRKNDEKK